MSNVGSYTGTSVIDEQHSTGKRRQYQSTNDKLRAQSNMNAQLKMEKDIEEVNLKNEEFALIMARVKNIDSLVENIEDNTNAMA